MSKSYDSDSLKEVRADLEVISDTVDNQGERITDLEGKLDVAQAWEPGETQKALDKAQAELGEAVDDLYEAKEEAKRAWGERDEYANLLQACREGRLELEQSLAEVDSTLRQTVKDYHELKAERDQARVLADALREDLDSRLRQLDEARAERDKTIEANIERVEERERAEELRASTDRALAQTMRQRDDWERDALAKEAELDIIKSELDVAIEANNRLVAERDRAKAEREDTLATLEHLRVLYGQIRAERDEAREAYALLVGQLGIIVNTAETAGREMGE